MRILKKLILLLLFLPVLVFFHPKENPPLVEAKTIQEIQDEIKQYERELERLAGQAKTLSNQIAQFNAQIRLTTLKIAETQEKILLLGGRIDQLEVSLETLTKAFSSRASETYKMVRLGDPLIFLISAPDLSSVVSRYHYLQRIQEADRDLLIRLQQAQDVYGEEKEDQEDLQAQLEEQGRVLGAQKTAKANLLAVTENDESRYRQLLARAKAQLAAFSRFAASQGGATILSDQTKCDDWGCYYNQRDSLWGNIGMGGSSYSVAKYGCLITSVSMIANHYGKDIKPIDIAVNSNYFVPGTGYLYHSAEGMPFSLTAINISPRDRLDSELDAGRPVIVGLYSADNPGHFIVIKEKSGDNYIMHDPFLENGSNRPLSDRYSVSDIATLRLISF
jgi:peptidoglycan hydrolase CwlO-like protein